MADAIALLQAWYAAQCNGEWEHGYGVRIETLDNPGWSVVIDLHGTDLADADFADVREGEGELEWLQVAVRDGRFEGHGGPESLDRILRVFLDWAHTHEH